MRVVETPLQDLLVVELDFHSDGRGFFVERFSADKFEKLGLPTNFAQDNHSRSVPGVLRGLHYQYSPAQGKLVGALAGKIWDVAVDIRRTSPTFGRSFSVELSGANGKLLWMPPGFAHGFCVIGDKPADILYKTTAPYNAQGESGIAWNDPDIAIDWPIDDPIISPKDANQESFASYSSRKPDECFD